MNKNVLIKNFITLNFREDEDPKTNQSYIICGDYIKCRVACAK